MSLSDEQIERYSRQILLPEVGGVGQERLLGATVALRGTGRVAGICGEYLAGAGIGRIAVEPGSGLLDRLRGRNPDSRVTEQAPERVDVMVEIGSPRERRSRPAAARVLCAAASGGRCVRVLFEPGRACAECLRASIPGSGEPARPEAEVVLGALVAAEVLRVLLGIGQAAETTILTIDLDGTAIATAPLPCPHAHP
ncbi:MAG: hypothetical protein ACREQY_10085 [Candidatus Binatia bacterium]